VVAEKIFAANSVFGANFAHGHGVQPVAAAMAGRGEPARRFAARLQIPMG
jgi:hypothetical protein